MEEKLQFVKVARVDQLHEGAKLKVHVNGKDVLLTMIEGVYYAIDNKCPHMGGSLCDGTLDGYRIVCPRHGSVFDVRTGKSIKGAKIAFIHMNVADTQSHPVRTDGDDILIGYL